MSFISEVDLIRTILRKYRLFFLIIKMPLFSHNSRLVIKRDKSKLTLDISRLIIFYNMREDLYYDITRYLIVQ